ncbi:tetA [Symbiodinium natans]|uniref:TetA protein n=1 Tax=Symbiodinium natans TaxID=878477 RepID=A0A812LVD1_9DINO|nr:tetA [Symbiodinium natans]
MEPGACDALEHEELGEVMLLQTQLEVQHTPSRTSLIQELHVGPLLMSVASQLQHPIPLFALVVGLVVVAVMVCGLRRCLHSGAAPQPQRETGGIRLGIYGILLTQTLNALATMVVLPTLPFFAMTLGASALEVSLMNSGYNLAQMFCSPLLGAMSDRYGRKRVMLGGICIQMVCNTFMAQSHSLTQLLLARTAVGMALSTGPVEMAYIMDFLRSEEELSRVLSLQRVMTSAGALAGPLVARTFDKLHFQTLCLGVVGVNVLNLLIGAVLWEDAAKPEGRDRKKPIQVEQDESMEEAPDKSIGEQLSAMFANQAACGLLLVSFVYALGFAIGDGPEMVFFKERFGFGKEQACMFYLLTNVSTLVCSAWVPALLTNFGALTLCIAGTLGGSVCSLLLVFGPTAAWVPYTFGISMVGLFGTMIGMGFMHLVREYCPEDLMGTMFGIQSSLNGAAGALAPPFGGWLYRLNIFLPFLCTSASCALTGLLYEIALPKAGKQTVKETKTEIQQDETVVHRKMPKLRRLSTLGRPIYHDKSFIIQVCANELSIGLNPESMYFYRRMRERLRDENVRGGMKLGS